MYSNYYYSYKIDLLDNAIFLRLKAKKTKCVLIKDEFSVNRPIRVAKVTAHDEHRPNPPINHRPPENQAPSKAISALHSRSNDPHPLTPSQSPIQLHRKSHPD